MATLIHQSAESGVYSVFNPATLQTFKFYSVLQAIEYCRAHNLDYSISWAV